MNCRFSEQAEDINQQYPEEEQQCDGTKQHVAEIVLPIGIAMSERMVGHQSGNQHEDPVDHKVCPGAVEKGCDGFGGGPLNNRGENSSFPAGETAPPTEGR